MGRWFLLMLVMIVGKFLEKTGFWSFWGHFWSFLEFFVITFECSHWCPIKYRGKMNVPRKVRKGPRVKTLGQDDHGQIWFNFLVLKLCTQSYPPFYASILRYPASIHSPMMYQSARNHHRCVRFHWNQLWSKLVKINFDAKLCQILTERFLNFTTPMMDTINRYHIPLENRGP